MSGERLVRSALPWARPLIGRLAQIEAFDRALADPRVRGVVVRGASGSGTSRLADHLVRLAAERRHPTARIVLGHSASGPGQDEFAQVFGASEGAGGPAAARTAPRPRTVLLVDELQHLQPSDADVLRAGLRHPGLFLLATVREGEGRPPFAVELARRDDILHLHLAPLDTQDTSLLLRGLLGADVDSGTLRLLDRLARGNVRILTELVDGLHHAGHLEHDGQLWRATGPVVLTPRLAVLTEDLLDRAGPRARRVLEVLALVGSVSVSDLDDLGEDGGLGDLGEDGGLGEQRGLGDRGEDGDHGPSLLAMLEDRGLIEIRLHGRRADARLAHPLFADVLRRSIPLLRRREILRGQADRIRQHGSRRSGDLLTTARLRAMAGDAEPALLLEAAEVARKGNDHTAVLALLDALPATLATPASELLRAEALYYRGDWQAADARLRLLIRSEDAEAVVTAVVVGMVNLFWSGAPIRDILRLARQARPALTSDTARRALDETTAGVLLLSGHPSLGFSWLDRLAALPSTPHSRFVADSMRLLGLITGGRAQDALEETERLRERLVRGTTPYIFHPSVLGVLDVAALTELGLLERAEAEASEQASTGVSAPLRDTWLAFRRGRCAWIAGRAADARLHYADAIAISERIGYTRVLRLAGSGLAASLAVLGDRAAAARAAAAARTRPALGLMAGEDLLGEAWLHAVEGRITEARAVLETACREARGAGQHGSHMLLLTDLLRLGGHEHADALRELAEGVQGPLSRARALYARAVARQDHVLLVAAAHTLSELGVHAVAADAAALAARLLRRARGPRHARQAELLAVRERQHLQGAHTPHLLPVPTEGGELTSREHEIALRAAHRMTSKEIAGELVLSVRTVDNTLQRVYRKLGVTNRRELAEALAPSPSAFSPGVPTG
ncbi:LuxR C-terminal-related transcriptional regulator [Streptomyces sp. NPDC002181]|uniref:helix-turn-helix transcriptional regulator n=1 Tax=Streptomyces sp. NPDC002181 TaxID=3364635 RepID=UPI0036A655A1